MATTDQHDRTAISQRSPAGSRSARASSSPTSPGMAELVAGLINAVTGAGLVFLTFLAAIPGLLPAVALTVLLVAVVLVPMIAIGAVLSVLFVSLLAIRRIVAGARKLI